MYKRFIFIVFAVFLLVFGSCNQIVENTNIPYAPVSFIIDVSLSGTDNELADGLLGNVKIYNEKHPAYQSYGVGLYGYSGVVVTRCYYDGELYAFDTCCPYEANKDIALEDNGYYMQCPVCGSEFQIFDGSGFPVINSSLTKQPMKRYKVQMLGVDRYLIRND